MTKTVIRSRDVLNMLNVSPATLTKLRQTGAIPFFRIGQKGHARYYKEDILKFIEGGKDGNS